MHVCICTYTAAWLLVVVRCMQEKRKRDAGQQSREKNYVEESKRQAREFGVFSGFD